MRKFLKIIFSRLWLVAFAIIAQLILSTALPYLLNYWHPEIFGRLYLQIDLIFNIIGLVMLLIIVNSDMIAEGKLADIAPTMIQIMGKKQPKEMGGKSLITFACHNC